MARWDEEEKRLDDADKAEECKIAEDDTDALYNYECPKHKKALAFHTPAEQAEDFEEDGVGSPVGKVSVADLKKRTGTA